MSRMTVALGRARGLLAGFTPGQRGVIVVAVVALVLGAIGLSRWAAQPTWTPLFSNLSGPDANAIVEQLRADSVQYQLADGGATVLVPQSQVYDLRVSLAGKNLPGADSDGYSILDKQGMTATDFQQNTAYQRALESELSKTLQAITGVQTALVHLAMPKKDVFATEQDRPTASVLLALKPGTELSDGQVRSITHLVAGSVAGLDPSDVNVSDSKGTLLSTREDGADGAASRASSTDEQTAKFEDRMSSSVQQLLDRVLGPNKAVVRVNAQLDFDTKDTTSERYVSESPQPPPLSEATSKELYSDGANGSGGSLGVTFPTLTPAGGATAGASYLKENRTVDNAVGKVVERAQAAPGSVQSAHRRRRPRLPGRRHRRPDPGPGARRERRRARPAARRHGAGGQARLRHDRRAVGGEGDRRGAEGRANRGVPRARQEGGHRPARAPRALPPAPGDARATRRSRPTRRTCPSRRCSSAARRAPTACPGSAACPRRSSPPRRRPTRSSPGTRCATRSPSSSTTSPTRSRPVIQSWLSERKG